MDKDLVTLITLVRSGDEGAFADLTAQYKPLIESMAKMYYGKYVGELYSEEDFMQEANMAFYSAVRTYEEGNDVTFGLYAKICIRNRLVSQLRTGKKRSKKNIGTHKEYTEPSYRLLEKEDFKQFEQKIKDVLSEFEWLVFCLYIQKKSYAKIAEEVGKSEKSVDNAIYRIKKKLKELL